jgi:predicted dehydrogenase
MPISRRNFAKMGILGMASQWTLSASALASPGQSAEHRVEYCVIGLGRIAAHFLEGTKNSAHSTITALVSGHRDKAERIAAQYGVSREAIYSYEEFDRIAANPSIDAVYVALPNSMHAEYTIRAAKAGKHVLCEKPMAISSGECVQMIEACKDAHVKLMIAYRLHFEPITLKALDIVRSGKLGRLQAMEGANGFNIKPGEWRYTKKLGGGGSLFDVGIYCLNAFRMFAGEKPFGYQAQVSTQDHDGRFDEVEENVSWMMRFPSGALATGASTYGATMPGFYRLHGALGWLEVGTFTYQGQRLQGRYAASPEHGAPSVDIDETSHELDPMQFVREADHFSECILMDRKPQAPGEEGLADLRCIEAIYQSAGVKL